LRLAASTEAQNGGFMTEQPGINPLIIMLLFMLRCALPLLILLGISALLRRLGLIPEPPTPLDQIEEQTLNQGGRSHGAR
jgi:hypothetical protein